MPSTVFQSSTSVYIYNRTGCRYENPRGMLACFLYFAFRVNILLQLRIKAIYLVHTNDLLQIAPLHDDRPTASKVELVDTKPVASFRVIMIDKVHVIFIDQDILATRPFDIVVAV